MSSLNDLLKKLEIHAQSGETSPEEVFESSFEILKNSPHDPTALRLSIVALITLERYLEAFKLLKKYKQADNSSLLLGKLYVYYKLNLNKELNEEFNKLSEDQLTRGLLHLKAQFYYRTGEFNKALEIYQSLIKNTSPKSVEFADLSVNERAVLSDAYQLTSTISSNPVSALDESSYDMLFNESLREFSLGNINSSLELLDEAQKKAIEVTDEEDKFNETLPIILQRAYVYQIIGKESKAKEILDSLKGKQVDDGLNKIILNNNVIALSALADPHISYKELAFPNSINDLSSRLSIIQKSQLIKNYLKLSLKLGKSIKPPKEVLANDITTKIYESLKKSGVLLDIDDLETQAKKSLKYARSVKTTESYLLAAQLNINASKIDSAINILESLPLDQKIIPGIASSLLSLYEEVNSNKKKTELFGQVYEYYSNNQSTFEQNIDTFEFLKIFSFKFWELDSEKSKSLLNLLNNYHEDELISVVLNSEESNVLTPINSLTSSLDFKALVQEGIDEISNQKVIHTTSHKIIKKRVQKRKRTSQTYDENKEADPERWLPMKDRSYYRPKKSKKNKAREIQTQGGAADNSTEEQLVSKVKQSTPQPKKSKKKGRK